MSYDTLAAFRYCFTVIYHFSGWYIRLIKKPARCISAIPMNNYCVNCHFPLIITLRSCFISLTISLFHVLVISGCTLYCLIWQAIFPILVLAYFLLNKMNFYSLISTYIVMNKNISGINITKNTSKNTSKHNTYATFQHTHIFV